MTAKASEAEGTAKRTRSNVPEIARHLPAGLELGLRNYWYPVRRSEDLVAGKPLAFKVLNEELVAWRDAAGRPNVVRDKCPHRAAKLSAGRVLNGDLQCAWHGLRFDGTGQCTLIPWEPEDSPLLTEVRVKAAYPAQELGGWIWCYIGEPEKFPPPPLEDVVPEELLHPGQFMIFPIPLMVWKCNWLQGQDGNDAYHANMLHSDSQSIAGGGLEAGGVRQSDVPLEDRRLKILSTPQGIRGIAVNRSGEHIEHGHFTKGWRGKRWNLPCLFTIPIAPAPGAPAYVSRVYQFPVDAGHTQHSRWAVMRASTDEEREVCQRAWDTIAGPRMHRVVAEDRYIQETLGEIAESRSEEYLFTADQDVVSVRRMFADAYIAQLNGNRPLPAREDMVFPF